MANSSIAFDQGGSVLRLGSHSTTPDRATTFDWKVLESVLRNGGSYASVGFFDDFQGAALSSAWATNLSASSTAAVNQQAQGVLRLTTHTATDANASLALGLHYLVSNGWTIFRASVKHVSAITGRALEVGLVDALSYTSGQSFTSFGAVPVAVATDAAVFGFTEDDTLTTYSAVSVKAGGTPQVVLGAAMPSTASGDTAATTYTKFTIAINASGTAYYFLGNPPVLVATLTNAVATTALLTPWVSLTNIAGTSARSADVDFVSVSGTRL